MTGFETLEPRRLLAAAGELDASFGHNGLVDLPPATDAADLEIDDRGRIFLLDASAFTGTRYTAGGAALDTGFAAGGHAAFDLDADPATSDFAQRLRLLPDGRMLIVGVVREASSSTAEFRPQMVRLNADGSIDTSFGTGGRVAATAVPHFGYAVTVAPDGKIVFAANGPARSGQVVRYDADGTLDTRFGTDGTALLTDTVLDCVAVQPDGKVVVAGRGDAQRPLLLARFTTDGVLDQSFGDAGTVVVAQPPGEGGTADPSRVAALALQADGKILVAWQQADAAAMSVFRFGADGSPDASFDGDGVSTQSFGAPVRTADLRLDPDGKIVVFGQGGVPAGGPLPRLGFALVRLNGDGSVDPAFGRVAADFSTWPTALLFALDPAGSVVIEAFPFTRAGAGAKLLRVAASGADAQAVSLTGGTLAVAGMPAGDQLQLGAAGAVVRASRNGMGKVFDRADVTLVSVEAGGGDDVVDLSRLGDLPASVSGGDGRDKVAGGGGQDSLSGNAGRDFLDGGGGNDRVAGNGGNDQLDGAAGDDRVYGGAGNDALHGGAGSDTLRGGTGDDLLFAGVIDAGDADADLVHGDRGSDRFFFSGATDRLFGDRGFDAVEDGADPEQDLFWTSIEDDRRAGG
jgi:uncharacterized delta-60 repeat protein